MSRRSTPWAGSVGQLPLETATATGAAIASSLPNLLPVTFIPPPTYYYIYVIGAEKVSRWYFSPVFWHFFLSYVYLID